MFTDADVANVRHVVQRILVPCVFVIGLVGNSVSIYVLTRKRMRCTTNIYLTALAITDIFYLSMTLLLSLQHYDFVKRNWELYWRYYGMWMWLCDACAYISIYTAVCFTIERFIAIKYPLKRQTFCTESLAKKVISGVAIFCVLSTMSTAFEHDYETVHKLIDSNGKPCNVTNFTTPLISSVDISLKGASPDLAASIVHREVAKRAATFITHIPSTAPDMLLQNFPDYVVSEMGHFDSGSATPPTELPSTIEVKLSDDGKSDDIFTPDEMCQNITSYKNIPSDLGNNALYMRIWYWCTLFVFVLPPLCILATFNCFLILLVRRSKSLRGEMTNASSMRRRPTTSKRKNHISSLSQENRITVTLIAVVLLFIVCQLPWAIFLIASDQMNLDPNLLTISGNICNFLVAINAAANFFLYCVLSDKYRKTVRELMTGYKYRHKHTNVSLYSHNSGNVNNNSTINNTTFNSKSTNGSRRYRSTTTDSLVPK